MPLSGVRVLDLTRLLPGPYATRVLAEQGAEVIKIEDPSGGDYARWYPPVTGDPPVSSMFKELNCGKKSVALDLKKPEAVEAMHHLLAGADVLVDSFRPGVLKRLRLDPQELMKKYERLIYCAITGFGLCGPDANKPGHDMTYCARAGVLGVSGEPDKPMMPAVQIADIGGALMAVAGITAALFERERTGKGRVVDIALAESGLPFHAYNFGVAHGGVERTRGTDMLDGSRPCYRIYRTRDAKFLAVGALEPKFWKAFLKAVHLEELEANGHDTGEAGERVKEKIQARLLENTRDEWVAIFAEVDACVEPMLELGEVEEDVHLRSRGIVDDQGVVRAPIRVTDWDHVEHQIHRRLERVPILGADTKVVLKEAGVSQKLIDALT